MPITSKSNARVKALRASFAGEARRPGDLLGLEGEHLIVEAMRSNVELETVFVREGSEAALERAALRGLQARDWVVLSAEVFDSAVETASPQGIAATILIPAVKPRAGSGPVLLLEALQDPGNLGTLLRSAEAFGASMVMMTSETVNPWNPKVVRSSAGSVFRMPMERASLAALVERTRSMKLRLVAAVAPGAGASSLLEVELGEALAVMIGNEGAGLSQSALALADGKVSIPCAVESLNAAVAGSTILYEAMRQRALQTEAQ